MIENKCSRKAKCYQPKKPGKRGSCQTPNSWIVFLRMNKNKFSSVKDLSNEYEKKWKKDVLELVKMTAGKDLSRKEATRAYRRIVCNFFNEYMKNSNKNTPANKKKVRSGVTKLLAKKSIPQTLSALGAKKAAKAARAKETKAKADVAAKKQDVQKVEREAAAMVTKLIDGQLRWRRLKKQDSEAKAAATKARSVAASASKAAAAAKRKAASPSTTMYFVNRAKTLEKSAKTAKTAAKQATSKSASVSESASAAKRKAVVLKTGATKVVKKGKSAEKDLGKARKTALALLAPGKARVTTKKKSKSGALAKLTSNLNGATAGSRGRTRTRRVLYQP